MRIIHLEDEWPQSRTIPHLLHDQIFKALPPESRVELDLYEEEHLGTQRPAEVVAIINSQPPLTVFSYSFITDLETLQAEARPEDIVIVDIMRSDPRGRFVPILDEVLALLRDSAYSPGNWRYFSAYPEKVPADCELSGFPKGARDELVQFLFGRVFERLKGHG